MILRFLLLSVFWSFCKASAIGASGSREFPPELFPGLGSRDEEDVRLAGVAAIFPGRLLDKNPVSAPVFGRESRNSLKLLLDRGTVYLRLYNLDSKSVAGVAGKAPMIVDCRYLATEASELEAVVALGVALGRGAAPAMKTLGDYPGVPLQPGIARPPGPDFPLVVLVNCRTSGPLEATLAALQAEGEIMLVGGRTAGRTGTFRSLASRKGWWCLSGEIFPERGRSLVGEGVSPKFPLKVQPEGEFAAWQWLEQGLPVARILRQVSRESDEHSRVEAVKPRAESPAGSGIQDLALIRALEILAALQALSEGALSHGR